MKNNEFGYKILRIIGTPLFKWYYNVKIIDKEKIPKKGAVIFCGNHHHFMDQCPVIVSTKRTIHWMSKKEYFEGKFKWFFKFAGCIRVDREAHDGVAINEAISYLKDGSDIGIFPEGTRNRTDAELLPFKKGAVKMAQETGVLIVPFAVNGDFKFRSKNLIVRFGDPIRVDKVEDLNKATDQLREKVLFLQRLNLKK